MLSKCKSVLKERKRKAKRITCINMVSEILTDTNNLTLYITSVCDATLNKSIKIINIPGSLKCRVCLG
jgi:hypothetical protein